MWSMPWIPDNIMTPFEYDVNPFKNDDPSGHPGQVWEVDGILDDGSGTLSAGRWKSHGDDWFGAAKVSRSSFRKRLPCTIVKSPTQKMTTSGKKREDYDPMGTPPKLEDEDLDQIRVPEGSLFVELYATHNLNNPSASGDLYSYFVPTHQWYLDLSRTAPPGKDDPANPSHSATYPVWRLAISKPHVAANGAPPGETTKSPRDFVDRRYPDTAETASFDPEQYTTDPNPSIGSLLPAALQTTPNADKIQLDRFVWFANLNPTPNSTSSAKDGDRTYYGRQYFNPYVPNTAFVPAGGYTVVGPRDVTYIGSVRNTTGTGQKWGVPSGHKISLSVMASANPQLGITDYGGGTNYPDETQIKPPVAIVAAANLPATPMNTWAAAAAPSGIGMSVSEPLPQGNYYPQPQHLNPATGKKDAYDDLTSPTGMFSKFAARNQSTICDAGGAIPRCTG